MDFVIFVSIAIGITLRFLYAPKEDTKIVSTEDTTREPKLNETFYEDPKAFCKLLEAVGFLNEEL